MKRAAVIAFAIGCHSPGAPSPAELQPGVIFTYPIDGMQDVPLGSHVVVGFSDPIAAASNVQLVDETGTTVDATPTITASGSSVTLDPHHLLPGANYSVMLAESTLFSFRTRSDAPRADSPSLVTVQGSAPDALAAGTSLHPVFEMSTLRLVFSEPLDSRTIAAVTLADGAGQLVPATVLAEGIHVSIDPDDDLIAGQPYTLAIGAGLADLDGHTVAPIAIPFTPLATRTGPAPIAQALRTQDSADATVTIDHPLIGAISTTLEPSVLLTELSDPTALGGPIAFTIRKGARLHLAPIDVQLDGALPSGLSVGDVTIEFASDADGRMYRNRYRDPDTLPDNDKSPLYVDLNLDVAVYASDPSGNAVLSQTVLGVQATGTAIANDGALTITTVASMDLGLLGIARAPSNFVMVLATDANAAPDADTAAPVLLASDATDLIFDEPIDLRRANAGGVTLHDGGGAVVPAVIESHGAAITLRPLVPLADGVSYSLVLADVADQSGNTAAPSTIAFATAPRATTTAPMTVTSVFPGAPCALTGERCTGGLTGDAPYPAFTLASNAAIEVNFTEPIAATTAQLGMTCGAGSVRVEQLDDGGNCRGAVPGTLVASGSTIRFYPDAPWVPSAAYRLTLVSGPDARCDAGELCGANGAPASFDPLNGSAASKAGGPDLAIALTGDAATTDTIMVAEATPGSRAALVITGHDGAITNATWTQPDCVADTPEIENCMTMQGAMPVSIGPVSTTCPLADGSQAASCIPVTIAPGAMYSSSLTLAATALGLLTLDSATGTSVMRIRPPASGGPVLGYIVDRGGTPTLVASLELYMDAPDMSLPLATDDLHSKPLSVVLTGPMTFEPDGRIAIELTNTADIAIDVNINAVIATGAVHMKLPAGEMKLELLSRPPRGGAL
jgi:hypothetical protein